MHGIEPFYNWRHLYIASEDNQSPFTIKSTVNLNIQIQFIISIFIRNGTTLEAKLFTLKYYL